MCRVGSRLVLGCCSQGKRRVYTGIELVESLVCSGEYVPKNTVALLDVCDALAYFVDLAGYISTQDIRVLLQEDACSNQLLYSCTNSQWRTYRSPGSSLLQVSYLRFER